MSAFKNNKIPIFVGIAIGLLLLLVIMMFLSPGEKKVSGNRSQKIEIQNGADTLIVAFDGQVELRTASGSYFDTWSSDKTGAFFDYFESRYKNLADDKELIGDKVTFYVSGNKISTNVSGDELVPIVIDDAGTQDGSGGSGGGSDDDISEYFNNTPAPTGSFQQNQTPAPTSGSSGSNNDGACKFWKISYCVEFRTIAPQPTSTPAGSSRVLPPDCADSGNQMTGRTVIGNELCVATPTPTPL